MTIKELKQKIMFLPDNMAVGGCGHFGEFLELVDARVITVSNKIKSYEKEKIFYISIEEAGEEPY